VLSRAQRAFESPLSTSHSLTYKVTSLEKTNLIKPPFGIGFTGLIFTS